MSTPDDNTPAQPEAPAPFQDQPWQVLIGLRATTDPATPSDMSSGLLFGMTATADVMEQTAAGLRPDRTNEAVHFAQWFDRNKEHIVALWRTEYAQYMNLRMATRRGVPGLRVVGADELPQPLVGADGKALQ